MEVWAQIIHDSRHTLYPVCNQSVDDIVGILNAKDYFRLEDKSRELVMEQAVTLAYFVPESVKADVLFRNMKHSHNALAVVLDEYGGVVGIVTLNDLVEQLVGDLKDDTGIEQIDSHAWNIPGETPLKEVSKVLGIHLSMDDCDTFNGLILSALDSIPEDGITMDITVAGLTINVIEIQDHQVKRTIVHKEKSSEKEMI